jgi:hypothetical protein
MKAKWYELNPHLLATVKRDIGGEYPDLCVMIEGGAVFARGSFPVVGGTDILDRFLIEVEFPRDYPASIPILRETGGRIPWHESRHTNRDGAACPIVPEEWLIRQDRDSILAFLDGPVKNFFLGQILVEAGKPWPFGERSHGNAGLVESYGELVGTTDPVAVRRYLDCLSKETVKGHWDCPCGSKKHLRNCHLDKVKALRKKIAPSIARSALARFQA